MYEHKQRGLLPRKLFFRRVGLHAVISLLFIASALLAGMEGYHLFEHLSWVDSFANASMILSGMGPLNPLQTDEGKIFAGLYALFSGCAFIVAIGVLAAPVVHRILHRFHLDQK